MPQGEDWLTTDEIARDLKVNVKTVRNWINSGELAAASWNGVFTGPGEIDSARMPCVANSRATPMVMVTTAPLAAA